MGHLGPYKKKWQESTIFSLIFAPLRNTFCPFHPDPRKKKKKKKISGAATGKANLVFKACENIQWCKNTCYFEVDFKACENIHLSKNANYWIKIPIGLQSSLG